MASVKVLKTYALEIGIKEKEWDEGVNKAVDKYYGSKFDEKNRGMSFICRVDSTEWERKELKK